MTFDGQEYQQAFKVACAALACEQDEAAVRARLESLERALWLLMAGAIMALFIARFHLAQSWIAAVIFVGAGTITLAALYWFCRLIWHIEISAHVKGRRFGGGSR
jgi:hypothetical protein